MKKKILFALLCAGLGFGGCTKSDNCNATPQQPPCAPVNSQTSTPANPGGD